MDVAPPPHQPEVPAEPPVEPAAQEPKKPELPPKPNVPEQSKSGVGAAIFATVVIVLGLAALATYAYLQSR